MSRRPGIGAGWFGRFGAELERNGKVVVAGHETPMPRYYRKLMDKASPEAAERLAKAAAIRQFVREPRETEEQFGKNEVFQVAAHNYSRRLG